METTKQIIVVTIFILVSTTLIVILANPEAGHDWGIHFAPAARSWEQPYEVVFHNPPWVALILYPLGVLPTQFGLYINGFLTSLVTIYFIRQLGGNWLSYIVTLLSPAFIALLFVGNIDWIPMVGLILSGGWSVPLLLAKPQTTGLLSFLIFKKMKYDVRFWLPILGIILFSLLIWGWWLERVPPLPGIPATWNQSPFPIAIPLGLGALWIAWRRESIRWGLLANLMLVPYFGLASIVPAVASWSARYPRAVGLLVLIFWGYAGFMLF